MCVMRKFAIFAPRFNDFKENDAWWEKVIRGWVVKHTFEIFILQRIPMIVFQNRLGEVHLFTCKLNCNDRLCCYIKKLRKRWI